MFYSRFSDIRRTNMAPYLLVNYQQESSFYFLHLLHVHHYHFPLSTPSKNVYDKLKKIRKSPQKQLTTISSVVAPEHCSIISIAATIIITNAPTPIRSLYFFIMCNPSFETRMNLPIVYFTFPFLTIVVVPFVMLAFVAIVILVCLLHYLPST